MTALAGLMLAGSASAQNYFHKKWLESEGVPLYQGYAVADARSVELKPWRRMGVPGAYINLKGFEGLDNSYVIELAAGQKSKAERHVYEEYLYVLSGEGETAFWQEGQPRQTVHWQRGSLLAVPLNAWHEHTGVGGAPARLLGVTMAPPVLDLYRDPAFIFENPAVFKDRYDGAADYFTRGQSGGAFFPENIEGFETLRINFIQDIKDLQMKLWDDKKGNYVFISMAENVLSPHVSTWPVGTYQAAHYHGPGAVIVIVEGRGYTLMWPKDLGTRPWEAGHGDKVVRVDWQEGSVFTPPDDWFHQHFNTGPTKATYLAFTASGARYSAEVLRGYKGQWSLTPIEKGGSLLAVAKEDPYVRVLFEEELRKTGVKPAAGAR